MSDSYRVCTRCIMDTTDPDIKFDENGACNHCRTYDKRARLHVFTGTEGEQKLNRLVNRIKERGKNLEYDCVIGLSGGVDSTYVAYLCKKLGLRPLAVSLDNGWDTEMAQSNVKNILEKLSLQLRKYKIDDDEVRDVELAYLKAAVLDFEAPTDQAIISSLYKTASEVGTHYVVIGANVVTEGIMPQSWRYNKLDLMNLKDIHNKFGSVELKTFPALGLRKRLYYKYVKRIKFIPILNYVPYVKNDAKKIITSELGWKDYGPKHFESIITRFYQAYMLPKRCNIDKRKSHLSALICSGQITRDSALKEMGKGPYSEKDLKNDKAVVLKKLGLTEQEFEDYLSLPVKSHLDYANDAKWIHLVSPVEKMLDLIYKKLGFD